VRIRNLASAVCSLGFDRNRDDKRWTELALNGVAADIVVPPDACAAARELARCSVAIVSRLHAGILAAVSGTPVVSLEYLPKCRDFALSIDDERSLIRTDKLSSTSVVDGVGFALAESSQIRNKTQAAVAKRRAHLARYRRFQSRRRHSQAIPRC